MTVTRTPLTTRTEPHFIGCWTLDDVTLCERLVAFFDGQQGSHSPGRTGSGAVDESVKRSTDLMVTPAATEGADFAPVRAYLEALHDCFRDYAEQWPFLRDMLPRVHIAPFNIQKYDPGGHFSEVHSERTSLDHLHRILAWMTYLNDVDDSGETEFVHYGIKVAPRAGRTLIWPAEWTHAHRGLPVANQTKYIITGWMHFPDDDGER